MYAPTSNTARHDNHEKINSWVSFSLLYEYGALLSGHCQNSAITGLLFSTVMVKYLYLLCQFAFFVVHTKHLPVRLSQIKIFIPALDLNQCMLCEIYNTLQTACKKKNVFKLNTFYRASLNWPGMVICKVLLLLTT